MVKIFEKIKNKNVLRRGSALTLALIVVISTCILPTFAADDPTEPTEPVYSEGLAYSFSGTNATVTGPGTWTGTDLVIPSSVTVDGVSYVVTTIGDSAFRGNESIVTVSLPVTCDRVERYAFRECVNLTTVNGGSAITNGERAFAYNPLLTSVDFSCWYSVLNYCFSNSGLANVVLPTTVYSFDVEALGSNLKTLFYSYPTITSSDGGVFYQFPVGFESLHYGGTLLQYCESVKSRFTGSSGAFRDNAKIYISGVLVEGALYLPDGAPLSFAFTGYKFIDTLYIPSSAISSSNYRGVFAHCTNLKTVYVNKDPGGNNNSSYNAFYKCTGLQYVYWGASAYSLNKNYYFQSTNDTFTLCLAGTSDQYTLTNFSNPTVYDSVFVAPDFTGLYSDSLLTVQKGNPLSLTLKPLHGYKLPGSIQFNNSAGESLGWTLGVEYTYDSTTGQISIVSLNQNVYLNAVGVSAVPNYRFFNSTLNLSNLGNVDFQFTANDFNGQTISGAFSRLNQDSLAYELYYVYDDSDQLVYNGSWLDPCYRYLDFGSNEIPAGFEAFLSAFASVPPIGSMLAQIYSSGGSSGGSYEDGYDEGYQIGFNDGRDVGYDEGYDVGFQDGSAVSGGGSSPGTTGTIFDYCTFFVTFNIRNNAGNVTTTDRIQIEPTMGVGTIDPSGAIGARYALVDLPGQIVVGCTFYMVWTDLHFFDYTTFPIFVTGEEAPSLSAQMMNVENQSFALVPSLREGSDGLYVLAPMYVDTYPESKNCTEIRMDVATPRMWGVTISTNAEMYSVGYGQGYGEGFQKGSATSSEQAYNEGMREGYITGKQEGIAISEKGNFYSLFASLSDATFGSFLALFNFEILGVNMQTIFGALLTLCVLLIVLFKFTGKKE